MRLFVDRAAAAQSGFRLGAAQLPRCRAHLREPRRHSAGDRAGCRARGQPVTPRRSPRGSAKPFRLLRQERRTLEPRQQTLEGALDWSYRLLEPDERTLLRRLAVFAGTFDLAAVEGVCAADESVGVLIRLVHKSLVVSEEVEGEPRYRLLAMIREYARDRLAEAGETSAMDARHARWYVELAERLRAMRSETRLRRLDLEPDNFRAALAWLLANDAAGALQLADSLGDWWLKRTARG